MLVMVYACMHACMPSPLVYVILIHAILIIADPSFSQVDRSSYFNTTLYIYIYIYKTPFYLVLIPVELHRRRPETFTVLPVYETMNKYHVGLGKR